MRFDDDRTACGERRRRVAARNRERGRKVARAEDRNRADRDQQAADVRLWHRRPLRNRAIDSRVDPGALSHQRREHAQLTGGTAALAREPLPRQAGFDVRRVDQFVAGVDLRRDAIEERRTRVWRQSAVRIECVGGRLERSIDERARRFLELR